MCVNNETDVYDLIYRINCGEDVGNIKFKTSRLKIRFFTTINQYIQNTYIINCNCSHDRLLKELREYPRSSFIIFDNINDCEDINILYSIETNKKLYIL
jgi:hypothetical protein